MERIVGKGFTYEAVPGGAGKQPVAAAPSSSQQRPAALPSASVIDTIVAEAGGEGPAGMQAVANVIKNRADKAGTTPDDIVRAPHQFEGYGKKIDPNQRAEATRIAEAVFSGQAKDITGGADHFHADSVQPGWAAKMPKTTRIGGHTFYASGGTDGGEPLGIGRKQEARKGPTRFNWASKEKLGDPNSAKWQADNLTTIEPVKGQRWTVYKPAAAAFDGLIKDLAAAGYPVSSSGGFNYRTIRGSDKLSQHAFGTAIDLNSATNPMLKGKLKTDLPDNIREIAAKHGLAWGGDFKGRPDPMHFEYVGKDGGGNGDYVSKSGLQRIVINRDTPAAEIPQDSMPDMPGVKAFDPMAQFKSTPVVMPTEDPVDMVNAQRAEQGLKPLITMPAAKYDKWKEKWDADQPGILSDVGNLVNIGWQKLAQAPIELVRMLPGGDTIVAGASAIDEWMTGKPTEELLSSNIKASEEALSAKTKSARQKDWWDSDKGALGAAWSDPRAYLSGVAESLPGTAVTMIPAFSLARGAKLAALAAGATEQVAAKAAAKTALIAGGIGEGLEAGGSASRQVRDELAALPQDVWDSSDAYKTLLDAGMKPDDAKKAIMDDKATQAGLLAGTVTGLIGGRGDMVLQNIINKGLKGSLKKRIAKAAGTEAAAEAIEETGQSASEQASVNVAVGGVDPSRSPTEGVLDAALGGAVTGGLMGGGMGGVAGAVSKDETAAAKAGADAAATQDGGVPATDPAGGGGGENLQPVPTTAHEAGQQAGLGVPARKRGPLERAMEHGENQAQDLVSGQFEQAGAPKRGSQVVVDYGDGTPTFSAKIHGYSVDGNAQVVDDEGEVHEVPPEAVKPAMPAGTHEIELTANTDPSAQPDLAPETAPGGSPAADLGPRPSPPAAGVAPTPEAPTVINKASLEKEFAGPDGSLDMRQLGDAVKTRVAKAFSEGRSVNIVVEGKTKKIVGVTALGMKDQDGNPWGTAFLLQPLPGNDDRIEIGPLPSTEQATGPSATATEPAPENAPAAAPAALPAPDAAAIPEQPTVPAPAAPPSAVETAAAAPELEPEATAAGPPGIAQGTPAVQADLQKWWDEELDAKGRKAAATEAGIKRSPHTMWKNFPVNLRSKLAEIHIKRATADKAKTEARDAKTAKVRAEIDAAEAKAKVDGPTYKRGDVVALAADPKAVGTVTKMEGPLHVKFKVKGEKGIRFHHVNEVTSVADVAPAGMKPWEVENARLHASVTPIDPKNVPDPVNGKELQNDAHNTLVLIACSDAKNDASNAPGKALPMIDLYNGPLWQDLRAHGSKIPDRNKFVISGKWGFVNVGTHVGNYDEKISREKVNNIIEPGILENPRRPKGAKGMGGSTPYSQVYRSTIFDDDPDRAHLPKNGPYTQVIIHGAGEYQRGFNAITAQLIQAGVIVPDAPVVATSGTILQRRKQFNEFLRSATGAEKPAPASVAATATAAPVPRTAPEHVHVEANKTLQPGVVYEPVTPQQLQAGSIAGDVIDLPIDVKAFTEITDEWAELFAAPEAKRVNMDKVAEKHGMMPAAAAGNRVDGWMDSAEAQNQDEETRRANSTKTILSLFDYTGEWSQPYEDAGYNVIRFDIQNGQDVMDFSVEWFNDNYDISDVYGILVACPCTDFASSGAKHFAQKDADGRTEASKELVFQSLRTIEYFRPKFWVLENPVGRIERLTGLPPARMTFNPWNFGAPYTKKTMLWGNFNTDLEVAPVEHELEKGGEGSKMHRLYGGKSLKTKNARSETPTGFAYSFFLANNFANADPMARTMADYPEASGAVEAAMKAGISEAEVRAIMYHTYENYEYEEARSALARAVAEKQAPAKPEAAMPQTAAEWEARGLEPLVQGQDPIEHIVTTAGWLTYRIGVDNRSIAAYESGEAEPPAGYGGSHATKLRRVIADTKQGIASHEKTIAAYLDVVPEAQRAEVKQRIYDTATAQHKIDADFAAERAAAKAAKEAARPPAPAVPPQVRSAPGQRTIPRPTLSGSHGHYTDLGIDNLNLGEHMGDDARDVVLKRGEEHGVESMVIIDGHGDVVANGLGIKDSTGMTPGIQEMMRDPVERLVLHHNHPSNTGFSRQDLAVARGAGLVAIYAHGADGRSHRAEWRPAARLASTNLDTAGVVEVMDRALEPLKKALALKTGGDPKLLDAMGLELSHLRAMAMRDAGWIFYDTVNRPDSRLLEEAGIKAAYDKAVSLLAGSIGGSNAARPARRAGGYRHPGDLSVFHRQDAGTTGEQAAQPGDIAGAGEPAVDERAGQKAPKSKVSPDQGSLLEETDQLPGTEPQPGPTETKRAGKVVWVDTFSKPLGVTPTGAGGKRVTVADVARAFTEEQLRRAGRKIFPETSNADYRHILELARREMAAQLPRENSGVGWYGADVELAIELTGRAFPTLLTDQAHRELYLTFAGIFSSGMDPDQAWAISAEAFETFLITGRMPTTREQASIDTGRPVKMSKFKDRVTKKMVTEPSKWGIRSAGNEQQMGMLGYLIQREGGVRQAMDWLLGTQKRTEINRVMTESGFYKDGRYTTVKARAGKDTYGFLVFGPKLGRYCLGLHGVPITHEDTTIDLWFTRMFRRWTGRLFDAPIGKEGIAAQPANDLERDTIMKMVRTMGREFNLHPGDVQAVLWFFEKRLWGAHGLRTEEGTNSSGARRLLRGLGIDDGIGSGGASNSGAAPAGVRAQRRAEASAADEDLIAEEVEQLEYLGKEDVDELPSGWTQDNPAVKGWSDGADWLARKQERADEDMAEGRPNSPRGSGTNGATTATAGMKAPLYLPVSDLVKLPGIMGEHDKRVPGEPQFDRLTRSVKEKGYTNENPVFVMVNHKGQAFMNEGNTRVRVAKANGIGKVKAWVHWKNGAELVDGPWSPKNVAAMERDADSLSEDLDELHDAADVLRGLNASARQRFAAVGQAIMNPRSNKLKQRVRSAWARATPAMLSAMYLNNLPDISPPRVKAFIKRYLDEKRAMDTTRNTLHLSADKIVQKWRKHTKAAPDNATKLATLMHDATIAGVDPNMDAAHPDALANNLKPEYPALRARFVALTPAGQQLFTEVRDSYKAQNDALDGLLVEQLRKAHEIADRRKQRDLDKKIALVRRDRNLSDAEKATKIQQLQDRFDRAAVMDRGRRRYSVNELRRKLESNKVPEPYFPLGRFGRFYVEVRDADGKLIHFQMAESKFESEENEKEARAAFPNDTVKASILPENLSEQSQVVKPSFIAEIEQLLPNDQNKHSIMDQIWQRYLRTMPELSTRSRKIHRRRIAGYSDDALRVYANHMFHAAHQMAKLKHGLELQDIVDETALSATNAPEDQQIQATLISDELKKRHAWVMNPAGKKWAQQISNFTFAYYLAASPAAAIVNLGQTPMVGIPVLGSRYGMLKSARALAAAAKSHSSNAGLSHSETAAMKAMERAGLLDIGQAQDIRGVGETGVSYDPMKVRVMEKISWLFQKAETVNRRVTALAAYRLAIESGASQAEAIKTASEDTWTIHFDYSNSSRPRFTQSPHMKMLMAMRAYQMNMLYRLGRDLHQAFKGETPQAKKEARARFGAILAMQALVAGGSGVAGYNTAFFLYGIIMTMWSAVFGGDDEEDPFTAQERFKESVLSILGPYLGGVVLNGVVGTVTGVDLANRVGMPDLWFRAPNQDLESGSEAYLYYLSQVAGASPATVEQMLRGYDQLAQGNYWRAFETAGPKFTKDPMKAFRYADEGLRNSKGDIVMDDVGYWAVIAQSMGFTPANVAEKWDQNSALKNAEKRIKDNRQAYINGFAMAVKAGDDDARSDALAKIRRFNKSPYGRTMPIKGSSLQSSLKHRAIATAQRKRGDGIYVSSPALLRQLKLGIPSTVE